jgi:hypothetical protein
MGILWYTRLCRRLAVARRAHEMTDTPRRIFDETPSYFLYQ